MLRRKKVITKRDAQVASNLMNIPNVSSTNSYHKSQHKTNIH